MFSQLAHLPFAEGKQGRLRQGKKEARPRKYQLSPLSPSPRVILKQIAREKKEKEEGMTRFFIQQIYLHVIQSIVGNLRALNPIVILIFTFPISPSPRRNSPCGSADVQPLGPPEPEQLLALAMQHHERFAGFFAPDFHVPPAQLRANAGAECLGDGLLGRKARRQERPGNFVRQAVGDFVRPAGCD